MQPNKFAIFALLLVITLIGLSSSMSLNSIRFVENNGSRLVATSNYNYAVTSPKTIERGWHAVSVNGDNVMCITTNNQKVYRTKADFGPENLSFVEKLRDDIANGGILDSSSVMMSSNHGMASSLSSSYSTSNNQYSSMSSGSGGTSFNFKDENNFSISKSDLPFNWSQVFFNGNLVTLVYKNGDVKMFTLGSIDQPELDSINKLSAEVKVLKRNQEQQFSNTMQQSMSMISDVFDNVMGRFPRPPDYRSSVGSMFGNNFPFGPNNSPFSSESGWPFAGSGAFAYAGRR